MDLTDEQRQIIHEAVKWFRDPNSPQVFEISGRAGTGKSVVLNAIVDYLHLDESDFAACAYTGAAALVMRRKGFPHASTLHSFLYDYVIETNQKGEKYGVFKRKEANLFTRLVIVDEAGFCDLKIKNDLLKLGYKVLVAGDTSQLPPVKDEPPAFFTDPNNIHYLTKIMRQNESSAIVVLANELLQGKSLRPGNYGDVVVITRSDFDKYMEMCIKKYGIILCGTNNTKESINRKIREEFLGYENPLPRKGERVINRKNIWTIECDGIPLVNGLVGFVQNSPHIVSKNIYYIDFKADFMNSMFEKVPADYGYLIADYSERKRLNNEFFLPNKEQCAKFEYAYACTTHVAQGSQFSTGIYIEEPFPKISKNLYYTGITRFSDKVLYVIPDKKRYVALNAMVLPPQGDRLIPIPKVK